jgi:hypothetical protein
MMPRYFRALIVNRTTRPALSRMTAPMTAATPPIQRWCPSQLRPALLLLFLVLCVK